MKVVGTSTPRIEGREKLIGTAQYVDDIPLGDFLWGQTVRSSIPYGKIKSISFDPSEDWSDVTIVTAADIPGVNVVGILEKDWPVLAKDRVYHQMEPILLLAHRSRERLYRLQSKVTIEYERWDPVLTIDESLARKAVLFKEDNIFKQIAIDKGDADAAFAAAAEVVERTYWTGHHEQAYIETNGMVAAYDPAKKYLKVTGSLQCPFYVLKGLAPIVGLPPERVEIEQAVTGGAFGGKEDFPTILAAHASLLSMKSGLPVKMIYDRPEDLMSTTKRHPCRTVVRTAHDSSGKITALEMDITMDGGAYCTLSPVVLSRGTIHAAGPYNWDNVRIRSRAVATNTPSNGA
ncbi:MAG: aerobic-type carbon monoxide dehydrogenase, large subunit CoxL/CutL-like protein, partial [bacterium]